MEAIDVASLGQPALDKRLRSERPVCQSGQETLNDQRVRLLWQAQTSAGIVGTPILYRGDDGRERIIVMSGLSGPFGTVAGPEIDVRDATAAQGMANALSSLPKPVDAGGTLNVFALP